MRSRVGRNRLWLAVNPDDFSCLASYIVNHVHRNSLSNEFYEKRVMGSKGKQRGRMSTLRAIVLCHIMLKEKVGGCSMWDLGFYVILPRQGIRRK